MDCEREEVLTAAPNVMFFTYPSYSHVISMLKTAELLALRGLRITFVLTKHSLQSIQLRSDVQSYFNRYPGFRFEAIPDGLPDDLDFALRRTHLFLTFRPTVKTVLRDLLMKLNRRGSKAQESIGCVIIDSLLTSFGVEVGEEIGIPVFSYCPPSACYLWAHFCIPNLIQAGELPFTGNDMENPIVCIPSMEGFLRRCDLPVDFRIRDMAEGVSASVLYKMEQVDRAQGLIINTFDELEEDLLTHIRSRCPKLYTIGPLNHHLKVSLIEPICENNLSGKARGCMSWLDAQPLKSVIYVSFGSAVMATNEQLMEFWHGLINSGKRFLWVVSRDFLKEKNEESQILEEGTRKVGYMVDWAPQEDVLSHQAIGGFLTHCGWNSIIESVAAGVPMICWPNFGDQLFNSRFVVEVWKLGLEMKEACDRVIIEKMIRALMDERKEEFLQSAKHKTNLAKKAISAGGSSYCNLDNLVRDIRFVSL